MVAMSESVRCPSCLARLGPQHDPTCGGVEAAGFALGEAGRHVPLWVLDAATGVQRIAAERYRQIDAEGWTAEHDDEHGNHQLARAAVCYVEASYFGTEIESPWDWPWDDSWWKPSDDPIRSLVKAGALIAAEIDRLERLRTVVPAETAEVHSA